MLPPSWQLYVRQMAGSFVNFFFPPVCASCKKGGALICADCAARVNWLRQPVCPLCGNEMDRPADSCYACVQRPFPMRQVRTAVYFSGPVQTLIHKFKYENMFALARPLADWMVQSWPQWDYVPDMIVPIPLHRHRQQARGYNQSELLAAQLCRHVGLPLMTTLLRRERYTQPQVGLSAVDRHANLSGAFTADADLVHGKHILLVDDVFTTGATLSVATEILLTAGAQTVSGYCLARAKQR